MMDSRSSAGPLVQRLADIPAVVMALGVLGLLVRTVSKRIAYPYDLEWMEGGMLAHAARVADGQSLYVSPSLDFIPFIYPPLYPWVVGGLSALGFPLDYPLGRAVSLLSVALAAVALALALRKEGASWALGIAGGGLFLSTYENGGAFFDLVRNDGLQIGLLAWALLAVRMGWLRSAGILLTGAFLTKHTAALYGVPALWWIWHHRGAGPAKRFVAFSVLPALAATIGLTLSSDGLFLTYLLDVPSSHPFVAERFFWTAPKEMILALPWMFAFAVIVAIISRRATSSGTRFWVVQGGVAIVLSAVMRGHHGGYTNVLIPGLWAVALWAGLAVHYVRHRWTGIGVQVATAVLLAWQLWAAQWKPATYIPTEADRAAGDRVVEQLREIDGPILAPWQPWMPVQAGKEPSIALIALWDIDHEGGALHREAQVIARSISDKHWSAVLTSRHRLKRGLKKHYKKTTFDKPMGRALYPKTGWRVRPHALWVPKGGR